MYCNGNKVTQLFCTIPAIAPYGEVFYHSFILKKGVLRNFAKFTGKQLCQGFFFNKGAGPATLLKKRLWHRCFPVNFAKFLRIPFLQNTSGQLLLYHSFQKYLKKLICRQFLDHFDSILSIIQSEAAIQWCS